MEPIVFVKLWTDEKDEVFHFPLENIESLEVSQNTKAFLKVGLPKEAAPFLSFGPENGADLRSVQEIFELETSFNIYKVIGFNSFGDPICVRTTDESIVYLNHDYDFNVVYINKSTQQFLESLLLFRELIKYSQSNSKLSTRKKFGEIFHKFKQIDEKCIRDGLWQVELKGFADEISILEIIKSFLKKST